MNRCLYWDGIRIVQCEGRVVIQKCPITLNFNDEIIKSFSVDEFEKEIENPENIFKYVNEWPKNHHLETRPGAGCPAEKCYCEPLSCKLRFVEVSLQILCNLNCRFCGAKPCRKGVDLETTKKLKSLETKVLNSIKGLHLDYIRLTDMGEPLLFLDEVKNFIRNTTRDDAKVIKFTTNGTLFDDELIDLINEKEKEGVIVVPSISLNAYDRESYIAKMGADKWDFVNSVIDKLLKSNIDFRVSFLIDSLDDIDNYTKFITDFSKRGIITSIFPDNFKSDELIKDKRLIDLRNFGFETQRNNPSIHPEVTSF